MATQVEIVNMALAGLTDDLIEDMYPDEDTTNARLATTHWDATRQALLVMRPWAFATVEAELGAAEDVTLRAWSYQYAMPGGTLKPLSVENTLGTPGIPWRQAGAKIWTNEPTPWLRYISDHDTPTAWSLPFAQAVAMALAARMAFAITDSHQIRVEFEQKATQALLLAFADDNSLAKGTQIESNPYYDAHGLG